MKCQTCNDFAVLQAVEARMRPRVPGLGRAINAFLMWHMSVVHSLCFQDMPESMPESAEAPTAAGPGLATTQQR